jgi:aryl-alcohol dehydrogenase-like predicted oxidoreductase
LLDRFVAAGGRLVETANSYAGGRAEREIGAWLPDAPRDVVCITKVGHPPPGRSGSDPDRVRTEVRRSLERLRVDRLDVVLLHRDDVTTPAEELLAPLVEAVRDGLATALGVANWSPDRLREAAAVAGPSGGLAAASSQLSLAVPARPLWPGTVHADREMLDLHTELGLPLLAWSANARGWFAGALSGSRRGDRAADREARHSFDTAANRQRLERCRTVASRFGVSASAAALAWTLQTVPLALPVIGPRCVAELDDAVRAARLHLPPSELHVLSTTS